MLVFKIKQLLLILFALSLFFSTNIYLVWHSSLLSAFSYILLIELFRHIVGRKNIDIHNMVYAFLFSFLFLWSGITSNSSITTLILYFFLPFVILLPLSKRTEILSLFIKKLFPTCLAISILGYVLWILGLYNISGSYVEAPYAQRTYDYLSYIFFLIPLDDAHLGRFFSYYDEPGMIGTLSGVILFFYKNDLSKYAWLVYFLTGVLSLSFFFMAVFLYICIEPHTFKLKTKIKIVVSLALLLIIIFATMDQDFVQNAVFDRFMFEDGHLKGNTRNVDGFGDYFWNEYIYSPDLLFGTSDKIDRAMGSCSIHRTIYSQGLLYVTYSCIIYIRIFLRYKVSQKELFSDLFIWSLFTYQRPSFSFFFYFYFFFTYLEQRYCQRFKKTITEL